MTPKHKKEEITATIITIENNDYYVDIPKGDFWENSMEAKFIICFQTHMDKHNFLNQCKNNRIFEMNCYKYTDLKVRSVWFSNMVRCRAIKTVDSEHILAKIFNGEIPF